MHDADYMLSIIDRGADQLTAEARERVDNGTFFGHVAYGSLTATRPTG